MLAAIVSAQIDPDHDTDLDLCSPERLRRLRRRAAGSGRGSEPGRQRSLSAPVWRGTRIDREEQLSPAPISRVRVREALVRLQQAATSEEPLAPLARFPEVRVDWVRSTDSGQRITRNGSDGFEIRGVAGGTFLGSAGKASSTAISIGVDGLIFSASVCCGDTAALTLDRLISRIAASYDVEALCEGDHRAGAILRLLREPKERARKRSPPGVRSD